MIYKRCPHCKKRVPEGEKCGCGYKREYAAPDKTRKLYHSSRWQKTRAAVVSFYSGIDDYCAKLLDPDVDVCNEEYFVDICEADPGDDIGAEDTWKKANPIRAYFPEGLQKIREDYEVARQIPEKMIAFMTKMLDMWVQAKENGYMDMAKWKACEVEKLPIDITGRPVYVGFDMSAKIDLTSVAFIVPYQSDDFDAQGKHVVKYVMWTHSFIPTADKLREHIIKDKMPYDAWERLGYLTLTNTPIVDQNFVMKYVLDTVHVGVKLASVRLTDNVREIVNNMVPANMVRDVYVVFNRWSRFKSATWGSLKTETWAGLHEDAKWQKGASR